MATHRAFSATRTQRASDGYQEYFSATLTQPLRGFARGSRFDQITVSPLGQMTGRVGNYSYPLGQERRGNCGITTSPSYQARPASPRYQRSSPSLQRSANLQAKAKVTSYPAYGVPEHPGSACGVWA